MDNLTHLYLGDNHFETIDLRPLPKGLAVLRVLRNELRELSLAGVTLPALTELDLESNALATLDLAALFTALPALRLLPIAYNTFPKEEAERIIADLRRHNVTFYLGAEQDGEVECDQDEYLVDNLCFADSMLSGRSFWKALFLIVVAVVVVTVFAVSVRWIWYQMRY
uniref:Leucine rich immune protein (Coil-less) n=1 Tax=Anopheles dirus TaxID=7168 RepID=A0A182N6D9_9DIPT